MKDKLDKNLETFLEETKDNTNTTETETVCDVYGNCVQKVIKRDKSIVERINKTIIIEDGRQLLT